MNMVVLVKGEERYTFFFDDKNRQNTLRILGQYASDPELSFTWYDAATVAKKIRNHLTEYVR